MSAPRTSVTIRAAADADRAALGRLAHLDSAPPLCGRCLVAEVDGELRAALGLDDARAIADPFFRCAELVDLLRLRATQFCDAPFPERPSPGALAPLAGRSPLPT